VEKELAKVAWEIGSDGFLLFLEIALGYKS
jgi:hypothetical protein